MGLKLVRSLPEGWKPEDYGFKAVKHRRATPAEIGRLYRNVKEESGVVVDDLEKYLPAAATADSAADPSRDPQEVAKSGQEQPPSVPNSD